MVSLGYARNLAEGHGLTWTPGAAPVEGYSNFLWTLWMTAVQLPGTPDRWASAAVMISGAVLLLANAVLIRAVARSVVPGSPLTAAIAVAFAAFYYPLVYWTLRGLEAGLVAVLMSASALLVLRMWKRARGADLLLLGAACAAGVLTRDDFAVFWLLVAGTVLATAPPAARLRAGLLVVGIPLVAVAGHEVLRIAYYGDPLPNTYYLKLGGVDLATRLGRGAASLAAGTMTQLYAPIVLAAVGTGSRALGPRRAWLLGAPFAAQCAYSLYVGGDTFEIGLANRFVSPAVPLLAVLAVVGARRLFAADASRERRVLLTAAAAFGAGAMLMASSLIGDPLTPHLSHSLGAPVGSTVLQVTALLALCLLCAGRAAGARSTRLRRRGRVAPGLAAGAIVFAAVAGDQLYGWTVRNAEHLALDRRLSAYGVALADTTAPAARVAVTAAGAPPYFSRRSSIDLLGKADRIVARGPSRSPLYWPGHTKWDYRHSIGTLRPDVIAGVWGLTRADERMLARWGYRRLAGGADLRVVGAVFVRTDGVLVDAGALDRRVSALFPPR
jgi:hypothetical protein